MTLEEKAFEKIKNSILSGRYAVNTHLSEGGLAMELNMSRTPIRMALAKLIATGMVTTSHRGVIVADILMGMSDLVNCMEFRLYIGIGCFEKAQRKGFTFPIKDMKSHLREMETAFLDSRHEDYLLKLYDFDNEILKTNRNNVINKMIATLQNTFILNSFNYFELRRQNIPNTLIKYESLINYLENKEFDKAATLYKIIIKETIEDLV